MITLTKNHSNCLSMTSNGFFLTVQKPMKILHFWGTGQNTETFLLFGVARSDFQGNFVGFQFVHFWTYLVEEGYKVSMCVM